MTTASTTDASATPLGSNLGGDQNRSDNPLSGIVWSDPERMSGVPCFAGTRVPVQALFDYLEGGDGLEIFLDDFEGVTREQAIAVIECAREQLFEGLIRS
jgi:uncharacterized protein (DUF433 family)